METRASHDRIVVGVDGSEAAHTALRWAAAEATRRDSALDVVHVCALPVEAYPSPIYVDPAPLREGAAIVLQHVVDSLPPEERPARGIHPILVEGATSTALLNEAEGASLLVVGSRGRGGFTGLLLGSVSRTCLHLADGPVVGVHPTWAGDEHGRIVVGIDGSEPSRSALTWAVDEAVRRTARLDVVNAYAYPVPVSMLGTVTPMDRQDFETSSRALLEQATALARQEGRVGSMQLISADTSPANALVEASQQADLLVVGSRGFGALRELLLGSVSQQCAHHASCPVVVVRGA